MQKNITFEHVPAGATVMVDEEFASEMMGYFPDDYCRIGDMIYDLEDPFHIEEEKHWWYDLHKEWQIRWW